jgi:DNA-3-methyladenine glycosylase II
MEIAIRHLKAADPVLARIIERVGDYGINYREPTFETLVRSIVFQQLSGRVARVIFDRLAAALPGGRLTPDGIMRLRPEKMRALGLSRQTTAYIRDLARRARRGAILFDQLGELEDERIIEQLTEVKGIGVWTVHMFLIFALRRPNVLPTGDLGIRSAIRKAYGLPDLPKPKDIEQLARSWHPYCSVACWYLWRSLETEAEL